MKYVAIKRYKRPERGSRRAVNIPYGAEADERGGNLYYKGVELCGDHSAVMREHFARNDDGRGLERGKLTQSIIKTLQIRPNETREAHDARWEPVWNDGLCRKYKKHPQSSDWLWSIEFFNAPIEDLTYIAELVGAKKGA